ncbi:DUF2683 family protein [Candidatus Woesearchaeota archaeon]|nr:DUF2683 family protein [Candidatus Woesearchaeota archaeon]
MVQAVINIEEQSNRVLNMVKAKYGLKDKSEAINYVVEVYEESFLEPELKPEYVKKIKRLERKGTFRKFKNVAELRKLVENA